jgi:hypothetical protein
MDVFFRKSMRVCNFTDKNGVRMPIETKRLGNDQGNELLELRMRTWLAGVPVPSLLL